MPRKTHYKLANFSTKEAIKYKINSNKEMYSKYQIKTVDKQSM